MRGCRQHDRTVKLTGKGYKGCNVSGVACNSINPCSLKKQFPFLTSLLPIMTRSTEALVVHFTGSEPELTPVTLDTLRPTEAFVEVHATGVCHTDIACMEGKLLA